MNKLYIAVACTMLLALSGCQNEPHITIEGKITDAKGKMLYFEHMGINQTTVIDSVKLGKTGAYKFTHKQPEAPDFYRLRILDQVINFTADSTQVINIQAPFATMTTTYTVQGSPESEKVKELTLKQMVLQQQVDEVLTNAENLSPRAMQEKITQLVNAYKEDVKHNYIFHAPNTPHAYFALFQKLGSYLIFDPYNSKEDIRCFQAVATSMNTLYPHALRAKNIYNIVLRGLKNQREVPAPTLQIDTERIKEASIIDIQLKDLKGNTHTLSELQGKVVLLDFTIYQHAASAIRNMALREVYNKYHAQGLEIYQISFDADEHYWKTSAGNLPWTCVRDAYGVYSNLLNLYNINSLPTLFFINRNGELVRRGDNDTDIEEEIKKLL